MHVAARVRILVTELIVREATQRLRRNWVGCVRVVVRLQPRGFHGWRGQHANGAKSAAGIPCHLALSGEPLASVVNVAVVAKGDIDSHAAEHGTGDRKVVDVVQSACMVVADNDGREAVRRVWLDLR